MENYLPPDLRHPSVSALIKLSLAEDLTSSSELSKLSPSLAIGDVTSTATLDPSMVLTGHFFSKADGVVAGMLVAAAVFKLVETKIALYLQVSEGEQVKPGQTLAEFNCQLVITPPDLNEGQK